jgi:vancomycin permeability regulator SanA
MALAGQPIRYGKIPCMFQRLVKIISQIFLTLVSFGALLLFLPRLVTARGAAIVFGAGLWRDGSPTPVLRDRVATAAQLYFEGKVEKILMSGDNRFVDYNEPGAMHAYALQLGVPEEAMVLDYAGRRTYDTCYRAKAIFGLQEAILVTQSFHLPRALYTCRQLGIDAVGVPADLRTYPRRSLAFWNLRELLATLTALWEVHIAHPLPVLGEPEPIFTSEKQ